MEQLAHHIQNIAQKHNIKVVYGDAYWADLAEWCVHIPVVENKRCYLAALHELGHILSSHLGNEEITAWEWAMNNSLLPIDQADIDFMNKCLRTYDITSDIGTKRPKNV